MATFHSGKKGTVTIGGTELPVISWSANVNSELVRFRNSKTGAFTLAESTFHSLDGSIVVDYDFDQNPFSTPLSLVTGATVSNVNLYANGTADTINAVKAPSAIITSTPVSCSVEGKIGLSFSYVCNGTFTVPGNITPA